MFGIGQKLDLELHLDQNIALGALRGRSFVSQVSQVSHS
jgi:hypothetical protein